MAYNVELIALIPTMNKLAIGLLIWLLSLAGSANATSVAVTIKPLHSIVASVMQGAGTPHLLLDGTVSPHIDRIRPSMLRNMRAADLFVWIGPGLESFMTPAVNELPDTVVVLAATDTALAESLPLRDSLEGSGHGNAIVDPHLWLDPANATAIAQSVALQLAQIDPDNAARYSHNASKFATQMEALIESGHTLLADSRHKPFVLFHDFAQYLENRFELNNAGVVTYQPQVTASAKHLKHLQNQIRSLNVSCVLTEPQFEDRALRSLSATSNISYTVIDPLASSYESGVSLYVDWFRDMQADLQQCLNHDR